MGMRKCSFVFIITAFPLLSAEQLVGVFLAKAAAFFFQDTSMGNSTNPSSVESSFRADRPTTLSLVNSFNICSFIALLWSLPILLECLKEGDQRKS